MLKLRPSQWDTLWFALLLGIFILPGATAGQPTAIAVVIALTLATWFRASVNAESKRPRWQQFIATFLILCAAIILTKGAAKDKWGLTDGPPARSEKTSDASSAK